MPFSQPPHTPSPCSSILHDRPLLLASLAPFFLISLCVALFGVDVLFWDEWMIWSHLLERMQEGHVSLSALVAQQNEQRNLAARIFGLLFMPFFSLNRFYEYAVMLLMTLASFLLLAKMWQRTCAAESLEKWRWLPVPISLLLFSTLQWQLFTFGINTSISLTILAMIAGAALIQPGRLEFWRVAALIAVGWAGSFNFANALFYWLCMPPLMLLTKENKRTKILATGIFVIAGVAAWIAYFHGYVKPAHHPSLFFAFSKPFSFIGFIFAYLGAPLVSDNNLLPLSVLMGFGAVFFMLLLLWKLWRGAREQLLPLAPWLSLALFALMSDGATAVGRAGFGVHQALQSRYITFANLFWVALLVVWAVAKKRLPQDNKLQLWSKRFMSLSLCVFILGSILSIIVLYNRAPRLEAGRDSLFSLTENAPLEGIFPDPNYLRKELPLFFDARETVFRDIKRLKDYAPAPPEMGTAGRVSSVRILEPDQKEDATALPSGILLKGQASPVSSDGAMPGYVLFVSEGKIIFATKPSPKDGSFEAFIPAGWFNKRNITIMPLAVLEDGKTAVFMDMPNNGAIELPEPWYPPFVVDHYFYAE